MGTIGARRLLPAFFITLLLILTTVYYVTSLHEAVPSPQELVSTVGQKLKGDWQTVEVPTPQEQLPGVGNENTQLEPEVEAQPETETLTEDSKPEPNVDVETLQEPKYYYDTEATKESEEVKGGPGRFYHIRPSSPTPPGLAIEGCEYPILIHTTPDEHCAGALALYASIVRNTLTQPKELEGKVCVHFTYVDAELKTLEEMYQWPARPNPYTRIKDCAKLDSTPALNELVPVRWQALAPVEKPTIMNAGYKNWMAALHKVNSWAFDLYPRVLILDADSFILTELHKIFLETPLDVTVAGAPDQFSDCQDRNRMNGGMILLSKPGRYFHLAISELLQDPDASCLSGQWGQSEQELLNCFCGYTYNDRPVLHMPRPEFTCRMMPMYNSVWPKNYGCSDANVQPMRSIHLTAVTKPWDVPEEKLDTRFDTKFYKCVRDGGRTGDLKKLKRCSIPELEITRTFSDSMPS